MVLVQCPSKAFALMVFNEPAILTSTLSSGSLSNVVVVCSCLIQIERAKCWRNIGCKHYTHMHTGNKVSSESSYDDEEDTTSDDDHGNAEGLQLLYEPGVDVDGDCHILEDDGTPDSM